MLDDQGQIMSLPTPGPDKYRIVRGGRPGPVLALSLKQVKAQCKVGDDVERLNSAGRWVLVWTRVRLKPASSLLVEHVSFRAPRGWNARVEALATGTETAADVWRRVAEAGLAALEDAPR